MTTPDEIERIRAAYAKVRAARTACTPDAPESVWQQKDAAEREWDDTTSYINPNGAVPTLLRALDEAQARAAALIARLDDFDNDSGNKTEQGEREWYGHVIPALSILRAAQTLKDRNDV